MPMPTATLLPTASLHSQTTHLVYRQNGLFDLLSYHEPSAPAHAKYTVAMPHRNVATLKPSGVALLNAKKETASAHFFAVVYASPVGLSSNK